MPPPREVINKFFSFLVSFSLFFYSFSILYFFSFIFSHPQVIIRVVRRRRSKALYNFTLSLPLAFFPISLSIFHTITPLLLLLDITSRLVASLPCFLPSVTLFLSLSHLVTPFPPDAHLLSLVLISIPKLNCRNLCHHSQLLFIL